MNKADIENKVESYVLKLYITGMSMGSVRAIENIKEICDEHLKGNFNLEIIDIHKFPKSMYENDIIASPTLIKKSPEPCRKLIGDLSNREKVLKLLSIKTRE